MGSRFFPCPQWVVTQQAAELFAAYRALTLAVFRKIVTFRLFLDNHAAIFSLLRGRANSPLIPQNRILRRVAHLLRWSEAVASLHYIPSGQNPANPLSRWWSFRSPLMMLTRVCGLGAAANAHNLNPSWGLLFGLQRAH